MTTGAVAPVGADEGYPSRIALVEIGIYANKVNSGDGPVIGAAYIDGFNLYHALDDLKKPHLKWLNLRKLAEIVSLGHASQIEEVVFATAYFNITEQKQQRHERFVRAQRAHNVTVPMGHMADDDLKCPDCGWKWVEPCEKQTDINIALAMYRAAIRDEFQVGFLVTADSDQVATLEAIKRDAPKVQTILVTPPGRKHSKRLRALTAAQILLTEDMLERAMMPESLPDGSGFTILRPDAYAPPENWKPPEERRTDKPKGKPPKKWGPAARAR